MHKALYAPEAYLFITVHGALGVPDVPDASDAPDVPDVLVAVAAFHIVRE